MNLPMIRPIKEKGVWIVRRKTKGKRSREVTERIRRKTRDDGRVVTVRDPKIAEVM